MGEELHPSLRHGRNRGLNGGVPEVVWFEGSVVGQLFMYPRTPVSVLNTAKWWAEYCSAPINYLGIGCILGVNQLHKSTLPIIHNTVVQGQDSHLMAELNIFLGDLNLCNTFCRKKVRLTVICCWVGQNYWRCEAWGWLSLAGLADKDFGWSAWTQTRPIQTNSFWPVTSFGFLCFQRFWRKILSIV